NPQPWVARVLSWKTPSELAGQKFLRPDRWGERLCSTCGHCGTPVRQSLGRREFEWAMWAICCGLAVLYGVCWATLHVTSLLPVRWLFKLCSLSGKLWLVLSASYSIVRFTLASEVCGKCGNS